MEKADLGAARDLITVGHCKEVVKARRAMGQKLGEALDEAIGSLATNLAAIMGIDDARGADTVEMQ